MRCVFQSLIINRPSAARAVLQTALSFIYSLLVCENIFMAQLKKVFFPIGKSGEASRRKICYQRGLPCLDFEQKKFNIETSKCIKEISVNQSNHVCLAFLFCFDSLMIVIPSFSGQKSISFCKFLVSGVLAYMYF